MTRVQYMRVFEVYDGCRRNRMRVSEMSIGDCQS